VARAPSCCRNTTGKQAASCKAPGLDEEALDEQCLVAQLDQSCCCRWNCVRNG
jgi:hypothetical protein